MAIAKYVSVKIINHETHLASYVVLERMYSYVTIAMYIIIYCVLLLHKQNWNK